MLTMSCNQPHFQALLGCVMDTWAKPLIQGKYPEITWFGYTSCDSKHPKPVVDFEDHMIYVDSGDEVTDTYEKTQKAYNLIKNSVDFDYVVRTNPSVYVNVDRMLEYINSVDEHSIIVNRGIVTEDNEFRFWLLIGFFMGMKKELFDIAMSGDDTSLRTKTGGLARNSHDDMVISQKLANVLGNNIKFAPINPKGDVVMYKPCKPDDEELIEKYKHTFELEFENPEIINEHILVRLRTFYNDIERLRFGHELEHFYELWNVIDSKY